LVFITCGLQRHRFILQRPAVAPATLRHVTQGAVSIVQRDRLCKGHIA
jgi:hypothetical protein